MDELILEEINMFLEAAWSGMLIAVAYDVLRILRRIVKHWDWVVTVEDYLFWVIIGILVFAMIFQWNDGIVRGYVIVTLVFGAYLYHAAFSELLVKCASKILNFILTILLKKPLKCFKIIVTRIWKLLMTPFRLLVVWVKKLFKGVKRNYGKYHDKKEEKRKVRRTGD